MSVDMQRGVYRKVYSGFIWGDRINSVSMEAEAWFWRLNAIADDFGNLPGDGYRVAVEAGGNRRITPKRAEDLTKELVDAGLVSRYADGKYIHVVGFEERQPAGRNGRKIQKYPTHPPESDLCPNGSTTADPGESGGIQNRPGDSCPPMPMPMPKTKTKPTADADGFEEFWTAWPKSERKVDKMKCHQKWVSGGMGSKRSEIMAGLAFWKRSKKWTENAGTYIEAPLVWLHNGRWAEGAADSKSATSAIVKVPDAEAMRFRQWWRGITDPVQRDSWAASFGVAANTVDMELGQLRVRPEWVEKAKSGGAA